jgi:hypothetical protein
MNAPSATRQAIWRDVDVSAVDTESAHHSCRLLKASEVEVPDGTSIITRWREPYQAGAWPPITLREP